MHEIINGNESLRPIIDFDLPKETLVAIKPKLTSNGVANILVQGFSETCKEVFSEWDENTLTVASSTDAEKISLHVSTYGMRVKNISQASVFTELVCKKLSEGLQGKTIIDNIANKRSFSLRILGSPKYIEKTKEHVRKKKALLLKNGTIYDFMLRPSNDESKVIESPLLVLPENTQTVQFQKFDNEISEASQTEFELVERLLKDNNIEGYNLSYPTDSVGDIFPLIRVSPSYCPLCKREHSSENAYIVRNKKSYSFSCYCANQEKQPGIRNSRLKLSFGETALDREKKLPSPIKLGRPRITDPNDRFV